MVRLSVTQNGVAAKATKVRQMGSREFAASENWCGNRGYCSHGVVGTGTVMEPVTARTVLFGSLSSVD